MLVVVVVVEAEVIVISIQFGQVPVDCARIIVVPTGTRNEINPANNVALEMPVSKGVVNPSTLLYNEKLSAFAPIVVICMKMAGMVIKLNDI